MKYSTEKKFNSNFNTLLVELKLIKSKPCSTSGPYKYNAYICIMNSEIFKTKFAEHRT